MKKRYLTPDDRRQIRAALAEDGAVVLATERGCDVHAQLLPWLSPPERTVAVLEPSELAARLNAERAIDRLGSLVGVRTDAFQLVSESTRVVFCADLETARAIDADVLVIDATYELGLEARFALAVAHQMLVHAEQPDVVLLCTPQDAARVAEHFFGCAVVHAPGRPRPVERQHLPGKVSDWAVVWSRQGEDVLVLVSDHGVACGVAASVREHAEDATDGWSPVLHVLSTRSTIAEHRAARAVSGSRRIVIASGLDLCPGTFEEIGAVVDAGVELRRAAPGTDDSSRRMRPTPPSECRRRERLVDADRGGTYVLCSWPALKRRQEYPADGVRGELEQIVLRRLAAGDDVRGMEFLDARDGASVAAALDTLWRLGAVRRDGRLTDVGRAMSRLRLLDPHLARMIVAAPPGAVLDDVVTIAACVAAGGIDDGTRAARPELGSDLLAELVRWRIAGLFEADEERRGAGIHVARLKLARQIRKGIADAVWEQLGHPVGDGGGEDDETLDAIVAACVPGLVDGLYRHDGDAGLRGRGDDDRRRLAKKSSLAWTGMRGWVVGWPRDLPHEDGKSLHRLLSFGTAVTPKHLIDAAPHLVTREVVGGHEVISFDGIEIARHPKDADAS